MAQRKQMAQVEQIGPDRVLITNVDGTTNEMALHVWNGRSVTIRMGLEMEMRGMRMTAKAPSCYTIIREELGIRGREKRPRLFAFCHLVGQTPSPHFLDDGDNREAWAASCEANAAA
jgi:hypothetical protein